MTKKLTLSIDPETIERAKRIGKRRGKSVSKMVEEFLNTLDDKQKDGLADLERLRKILEPYQEKFNIPPDKSYKDMIRDWRNEDYLANTK